MKKIFILFCLLFCSLTLSAQSFISEWEGHNGTANSVVFTKDGLRLITSGNDGSIRIFNLSDNSLFKIIQSKNDEVRSMIMSDDGTKFAVTGDRNMVEVYSYPAGALIKSFIDTCASICFTSDGSKIISCSDFLHIWDVASATQIKSLPVPKSNRVIITKEIGKVLLAGDDSKIYLFDYNTGQIIRTYNEHIMAVLGLALSPDGSKFASSSADRTIRIWDINSTTSLKIGIAHLGYVYSIAYSNDGTKLITACEDTRTRLYGTNPVDVLHTYWDHRGAVYSAAFSPNGEKVASVGEDGIIKIWDTTPDSYLLLESIPAHTGIITNIEYSPDGFLIATSGYDNSINIWDPALGFQMKNLTGHTDTITSIKFFKDAATVISGSVDGRIRLWNLSTGKSTLNINNQSAVLSLAAGGDFSKIFSSGANGVLKAFNSSGILLKKIDSNEIMKRALAYDPNNAVLLAGDDAGFVKIYSVSDYTFKKSYDLKSAVKKIVISDGGTYYYVLLKDNSLTEIASSTGTLRSIKKDLTILDVVVSTPKIALVLSGGTVEFLRQSDLSVWGGFKYSSGYPNKVAFNPAGDLIALGGLGLNNIKVRELQNILSAENLSELHDDFKLYNNFPNPFNPSTNIRFGLSLHSEVRLEIYNILGQLVDRKLLGEFKPGIYTVSWNPQNLSGGTYFYTLRSSSKVLTGKMIYLK